MQLTGKDIYDIASVQLKQEGYEDIDWDIALPETRDFYNAIAQKLTEAHFAPLHNDIEAQRTTIVALMESIATLQKQIAPLQGLVKELEELVGWDDFTEGYEKDVLKRIEQLCGGQS